jgi:hypothetical protein
VPQEVHGSSTILLAEDERALRRLSATVLGQAGYGSSELSMVSRLSTPSRLTAARSSW